LRANNNQTESWTTGLGARKQVPQPCASTLRPNSRYFGTDCHRAELHLCPPVVAPGRAAVPRACRVFAHRANRPGPETTACGHSGPGARAQDQRRPCSVADTDRPLGETAQLAQSGQRLPSLPESGQSFFRAPGYARTRERHACGVSPRGASATGLPVARADRARSPEQPTAHTVFSTARLRPGTEVHTYGQPAVWPYVPASGPGLTVATGHHHRQETGRETVTYGHEDGKLP
jgi:hypothetical protein